MQQSEITYPPIDIENEPGSNHSDRVEPAISQLKSNDLFSMIADQIVSKQKKIIGILAIEQAAMVEGIRFDTDTHKPTVVGNGAQVIDALINQYRDFFGSAAVEVCRDAASPFISQLSSIDMPSMLKLADK